MLCTLTITWLSSHGARNLKDEGMQLRYPLGLLLQKFNISLEENKWHWEWSKERKHLS